jgi:hypothetical protein
MGLMARCNTINYAWSYKVYYNNINDQDIEELREALRNAGIKVECEPGFNRRPYYIEVFFTDFDGRDIVEGILNEHCDLTIEDHGHWLYFSFKDEKEAGEFLEGFGLDPTTQDEGSLALDCSDSATSKAKIKKAIAKFYNQQVRKK